MNENLSLADIAAVTKSNEGLGGIGGGYGWLIIILLFFMVFGGGFFGGRSDTNLEEFQTQKDVLTSSCSTQKEILQSRYDNALAMNNLQAQMAQCCCDIKGAISADGQATRALITDNTINDLREKLNSANAAIVNANQSQYILGQLGRYTPYSYLNSVYGYGTYGSYSPYYNGGTTI